MITPKHTVFLQSGDLRRVPPYSLGRGDVGGFSLLGTLGVIVVMALLIAIMVPTFLGIKAKARSVQCLSSLRQIHTGAMLYAADHDGWIPPAYQGPSNNRIYWFDEIAKYLDMERHGRIDPAQWKTKRGSTFHCPDENLATGISYSYNRNINRGSVSKRDRVWKFNTLPTGAIFIVESRQKPELSDYSPQYGGLTNADGTFRFGQRHGNKAHVLFFGGQIATVDTTDDKEIRKLRWTWPGWEN